MNIQKLSYVFLLCFSVFAFTGCEDDENGGHPQTVGAYGSIPTEALNKMHWRWGIASRINDETSATFVCNRDSLGGRLCGRLLCKWLQLAHHAYVFRG